MVLEFLILFAAQGPVAPVEVHADSPRWREWQVVSDDRLSREERCQYRVDARRLLRGSHVTRGLPFVCMDRQTRRVARRGPDPAPSAR